MKKSVRMMLSVALTLMLVLTVLPIGAFAAEVEGTVEPAAVCNHLYETTIGVTYEHYDQSQHEVISAYHKTCVHCGHMMIIPKGEPQRESHDEESIRTYYEHDPLDFEYHSIVSEMRCTKCYYIHVVRVIAAPCYCERF